MTETLTAGKEMEPKARFEQLRMFLVTAEMSHRGDNPLRMPLDSTPVRRPVQIGVDLTHMTVRLGDETWERPAVQVRLRVATDPDDGDPSVLYDFTVVYAAIVYDVDPAIPDVQLADEVAALLYPFAKEAVINLTSRALFGAAVLPIRLYAFVADQEALSSPPPQTPR